MKKIFLLLALVFVTVGGGAQPASEEPPDKPSVAAALPADFAEKCKAYEEQVIQWRREFHEHPELGFREEWTSLKIQEILNGLGIPFELIPTAMKPEELALLGVPPEYSGKPLSIVARINGASPGKKIALRADIDALPLQEEAAGPVKSQIDGVMHACGHDAHIAMLLGTAAVLNEYKNTFRGTVYLCFQIAEELGGGAPEIVQYLKDVGGVDNVIALHIFGSIPVGKIGLKDGTLMAGLFGFMINIKGEGGHGSRPDLVKDPIKPAADLILKLSSIPANFYDMMDNAVVHVCFVRGGTTWNVFPDSAQLQGGVRFLKGGGAVKILDNIRRISEGVGKTYDVDVTVIPSPVLAPVINDATALAKARAIVKDMEGLEEIFMPETLSGSDNYSVFLEAFPGFYGILGAANEEKGINWIQHSSHFDIDEAALEKGTEFMARYALEFLAE